MLFDLFALIDFSEEIKRPSDPFAGQEGYQALRYQEVLKETPDCSVRSLFKHLPDPLSYFEDESFAVYVYGYCFPRMDSSFFKEDKRLTAQQLADGYHQLQQYLLKQIKGSFSLLIYDKKGQQVQLFTDPFNVRPMYYQLKENRLAVSTSLSAIMQYLRESGQPVEVDETSVLEYYLFEYVLGDQTYIQSVSCMPAGGWLSFSEDGLEVRNYWDPFAELADFNIQYKEEEAVEVLEKVLKHNLDLYLSGNRPTAVALTGGYDSRTNLALLGDKAKDYLFYSYGIKGTYDLAIPQKISKSLGLNFKPIYLDQSYQDQFSKYARQAISLGDGIAEASRANYLFAFDKLGTEYDSILTGLFGSELIKHPTSVGNFIDQNMKRLLNSQEPELVLKELLEEVKETGCIQDDMLQANRSELESRVLGNRYVINKHTHPIKYFYFLLMVGVRKYFMKEIKVERPFVENLHPFLDIEFVESLLKTPFPWVYHWTGRKDLLKSLQTHRFYVSLIHKNQPKLSGILSTHGYKPRYLLNKATLPLMSVQYLYYKDKIKAKGSFNSLEPIWDYFKEYPVNGRYEGMFNNAHLRELRQSDSKNNIKLSSLQHWLSSKQVKV